MRQEIAPLSGDMLIFVQRRIIALGLNAVQQGRVAGNQMACESEVVNGTYSVNAIDSSDFAFAPAVL